MPSDSPRQMPTPRQRRLINAAAEIRQAQAKVIEYLHSVTCQTSLPYRNPGPEVRVWERTQGDASLRIEAGAVIDPTTNQFVPVGLPYGERPRLLLIHLSSEAIRTGSPLVDVEDSMTGFARSLGVDTNGPSLRTLKDQLTRLSAATIRLGFRLADRTVQVNTQIVKQFDLWFPREPNQQVLWPSQVRLSDEFYGSLVQHAVPLDSRAIGALAHSALALDIYVWLAQRLHRVNPHRPQRV